MKTMYAIRVSPKGRKPVVIRLDTEQQARHWVDASNNSGTTAKYIGKVKVACGKLDVTNADPKKR